MLTYNEVSSIVNAHKNEIWNKPGVVGTNVSETSSEWRIEVHVDTDENAAQGNFPSELEGIPVVIIVGPILAADS